MKMSFTDIFIRRPVLASVVSLLILLVGLQCAFKLQVRQFPELSSTTITITTSYPGANADVVKGYITTPIAQAVASAEGIDTLVSSSQQNASTITLNLLLNANRRPRCRRRPLEGQPGQISAAARGARSRRRQADRRIHRAFIHVLQLEGHDAFADHRLPDPRRAAEAADDRRRRQRPDSRRPDIRDAVWLDPNKMAARGVTPNDVGWRWWRIISPSAAGQIKGDFVQTSINAQTSLDSAGPSATGRVGARRCADAARRNLRQSISGRESVNSSSVFDGLKAVFIGIYSTPDRQSARRHQPRARGLSRTEIPASRRA